jgi:hypothetical protein
VMLFCRLRDLMAFRAPRVSLCETQQTVLASVGLSALAVIGLAAFCLPYGHHPTDDGWILAFAWRVFHGEVPHRDFIYVRPPLSPVLHSIWFLLPVDWQFWAARLSYHIWMGLIFLLPPISVAWKSGMSRWQVFVLFSMSGLGWLYSLHRFPSMPWYTVDALLFSALGLAALYSAWSWPWTSARNQLRMLFAGAIASGFAPWAKQNFALIPMAYMIAGSLLVLIISETRAQTMKRCAVIALGAALPSTFFVLYLSFFSGLDDFIDQLKAVSGADDLIFAGIVRFLPQSPAQYGLLMLALMAGAATQRAHFTRVCRPALRTGFPLFLMPFMGLAYGLFALVQSEDTPWAGTGFSRFLFLLFCAYLAGYGIMIVLGAIKAKRLGPADSSFVVFGVGSILTAWCASISWGYQYPILGFAPLACAVGLVLIRHDLPIAERVLGTSFILLFLALGLKTIASVNYWRPYRDVPRLHQSQDLAAIFPKFGPTLKTGEKNFTRYLQLKNISTELTNIHPDRSQVVLPDFPLFYFLTDRMNPVSVDWWLNGETGYLEDRLKSELLERKPLAIIEMEPGTADCREPIYKPHPRYGTSEISLWIVSTARLLLKRPGFCAFDLGENPGFSRASQGAKRQSMRN